MKMLILRGKAGYYEDRDWPGTGLCTSNRRSITRRAAAMTEKCSPCGEGLQGQSPHKTSACMCRSCGI